jgi:hypothetical protein
MQQQAFPAALSPADDPLRPLRGRHCHTATATAISTATATVATATVSVKIVGMHTARERRFRRAGPHFYSFSLIKTLSILIDSITPVIKIVKEKERGCVVMRKKDGQAGCQSKAIEIEEEKKKGKKKKTPRASGSQKRILFFFFNFFFEKGKFGRKKSIFETSP